MLPHVLASVCNTVRSTFVAAQEGGPSYSPHFTDEEKGWTPLRSLPRAVLW